MSVLFYIVVHKSSEIHHMFREASFCPVVLAFASHCLTNFVHVVKKAFKEQNFELWKEYLQEWKARNLKWNSDHEKKLLEKHKM